MNITVTTKYDDEKLVFNQATDRYELSIDYVRSNFENNFQDDGILQKRITKNSRKIYNYILSKSYTSNREVILFMLNRTLEGRRFLFDVLVEQMEADLENGYNDLTLNPAINLSNGGNIGRDEMRANKISIDAEDIIDNNKGYFGFNIMFQSLLPPEYFRFIRTHGGK